MIRTTQRIAVTVPLVALGLIAATLITGAQADVGPVVLGARQMDSVTASAPAAAIQTEPTTHRDTTLGPIGAEVGGDWMSVSRPGMVAGVGSVTPGLQRVDVAATPADAQPALVSGSSLAAGGSTLRDGGTVDGGRISRSLTSIGLGSAATSSASAFGTGTASVFISSNTAFGPSGLARQSFSSSFAQSSSSGAR